MPGPSLDLDWELGLFKSLRALWRAAMPTPGPGWDPRTVAHAEPILGRLGMFGSIIAGRPIRVESVRGPGGVRGSTLLVPEALDLAPDAQLNGSLYLIRVAVDAATIGRGFVHTGAEASQREADRSIRDLGDRLPRFGEAYAEARALVEAVAKEDGRADPVLWGRLLEVRLPDGPGDGGDGGDGPPASGGTEHEARDITDIEVLELDEEKDVFDAPLHSFEKIELLEGFKGHLRQLDGDDDLQAHLDALDEVDLTTLVRGGPQAHSMLRAEVGLEARIPDVGKVEPGEDAVLYPEWDHASRRLRPDWCAVYPTALPDLPGLGLADESLSRQARILREVREQLLVQRQRRRRRPRCLDGDAIDLDAAIASMVDRRAGKTPSPRVYERAETRERDVATTLLVDISLSADSWVDGRRVWDVTRDALWVLGEASAEVGDAMQILAFASHTRHRVRVYTVLDWDEPWVVGRRRLEHLEPQGYTRIGPAIRHATRSLEARSARARQLLLVSDCKPTDYDRYEGSHGTHDVRRALEEARAKQIVVFGIAVDRLARDRLPTMFGPGGWSLLAEPTDLVRGVERLYR